MQGQIDTHQSCSSWKSLFSNVIDELYKNTDLFELWVGTLTKNYVVTYDTSDNVENIGSILHSVVPSCGNFIELYHSVIQLFLKASFNQFRRDFLSFLKKENGMQFLKEAKSKDRISSHLQLKSEVTLNEKIPCIFHKKDLLLLCQMHDVKMSSQKKER